MRKSKGDAEAANAQINSIERFSDHITERIRSAGGNATPSDRLQWRAQLSASAQLKHIFANGNRTSLIDQIDAVIDAADSAIDIIRLGGLDRERAKSNGILTRHAENCLAAELAFMEALLANIVENLPPGLGRHLPLLRAIYEAILRPFTMMLVEAPQKARPGMERFAMPLEISRKVREDIEAAKRSLEVFAHADERRRPSAPADRQRNGESLRTKAAQSSPAAQPELLHSMSKKEIARLLGMDVRGLDIRWKTGEVELERVGRQRWRLRLTDGVKMVIGVQTPIARQASRMIRTDANSTLTETQLDHSHKLQK